MPDQGFYTTVANVDYALEFLAEARAAQKPWFFYVAFNAPHAPLQPLEADYEKYRSRYDAGWAWASNTPFRLYKQNQFEGGIATPAIFHWPAGIKAAGGRLVHAPAHLVDVLPTVAEVTAEDRTELHNLAAEYPDIVARMAKQWTDMARDVLQCQPREYREVAATVKTPRRHPEWSDYAEPVAKSTRRAAKKAKSFEPGEP